MTCTSGASLRRSRQEGPQIKLRRFRELRQTGPRAEGVLAVGHLERETGVARLRHVDDHVADRIEDLRVRAHLLNYRRSSVGGVCHSGERTSSVRLTGTIRMGGMSWPVHAAPAAESAAPAQARKPSPNLRSSRAAVRRALAIAVFSLAAGGATPAGSGLVDAPHPGPAGAPPIHGPVL